MVNAGACFPGGIKQGLAQYRTEGLGERNMDNDTLAEEGIDPALGAVNELVGNNQVAGFYFLLEAADGINGNDVFHPERLEGIDIGPHRDFGG